MLLDSTSIKVDPGGTEALKKLRSIGKCRGGWNNEIHMVAANARTAVAFHRLLRQAQDVPEGQRLLHRLGAASRAMHLLLDRAYEGNETRQLELDLALSLWRVH